MKKKKIRKMPKPDVMPEYQTRKKILEYAHSLGCLREVSQLMDKYDGLLKNCTNETERKHIATIGISEIHKLIGFRGGLAIGDQQIVPPSKEEKSELLN